MPRELKDIRIKCHAQSEVENGETGGKVDALMSDLVAKAQYPYNPCTRDTSIRLHGRIASRRAHALIATRSPNRGALITLSGAQRDARQWKLC